MSSQYAELTIDRGATYETVIYLTNDDNTPMNLNSAVISCSISKSYYSVNVTANLTVTIDNEANGEVRMALDAANTSNIKPGRYLYDVKMTTANNVTIRVIEGIATVTPQVTR